MRFAGPPRFRSLLALGLVASITCGLVPATMMRVAYAQKGSGGPTAKEMEEAKKKFFEGMELEGQKKWGEALKNFQDVAKVRMTPQVRFHIALCEENEGMLIEALRDFEVAERDAKAGPNKVETVAKEAPEHAAAIKAKIPKVRIKLPDAENLAVTIDSLPVDAKGAEEIPLNPGAHKIEATADKMNPYSLDVKLEEGETKNVVIKMVPVVGEKKKEDDAPPPEKKDVPKNESDGAPVGAIVVGSIGVAALIGAGAFYLMRNSAKNDLDSGMCGIDGDALKCRADAQDTIDKGKTFTTLTNVFAIVGIVGVGAGIVLFATSGKSSDSSPAKTTSTIRLVPGAPGANIGGFALTGAF